MLTHNDHSERIEIASLIPHKDAMCLLDEIVFWNDLYIRCTTASHRNPANPLRGPSGLLSVCGIEYAAQAIAVHGGLLQRQSAGFQAPSSGYLANAKDVRWTVDRLDDIASDLLVEAEQMISEGGRSIYAFNLSSDGRLLMQGRVAVVLEGANL
ncbi:MAG TPA: 3-hydroxylacyl-ACP dehydratase [Burkholderiaceae bacterium]|jgi:predicted hotdog family 3-hydroxylacyl-ACP dehydratase|nr:3-hydroxylacyl-ACP dehydratase [Burkholderiaceae bacterium]